MRFALFSIALLVCPALQATSLGVAAPWNAFIFNSINYMNTGVADGLAAGTSINLTNMSVAIEAASGNTEVELLSGGSVSIQSGFVNGSIQYATTISSTAGQPTGATISQAPSPFDFAMHAVQYQNLSTQLANQTPNGTTDFQFGTLTLTGSNPDTNFFTVDPLRTTASNVVVSIPTGATAIINFTSTSVFYQYGGVNTGSTPASRILWNAPNATTGGVIGVPLIGSILAPRALVDLTNGTMRGQVIANNLTGASFGLNYEMFDGNLGLNQVPEPSTFLLAAPALLWIVSRSLGRKPGHRSRRD